MIDTDRPAEHGSSGEEAANNGGINIQLLAEKVYRLMQQEVRLSQARGQYLDPRSRTERWVTGWD